MTAPTCQNCRHWSHDPHDDLPQYGSCDIGSSRNGKPIHPTAAFGEDGEQYSGYLRTLPTFSCNQHQPREE